MGICSCRNVRGDSTEKSIHSECRAIDLAANAHNPVHKVHMDNFVDWMIENSEALQIQYIIWNRMSWKSGRGWKRYTGINPHTDHAHVEFNRDGAENVHPLLTEDEDMALDPKDKEDLGRWMQEQSTNVVTLVKGMIDDFNEAAAEREWKTRRVLSDLIDASGTIDRGKLSPETIDYLKDAGV